MAPEDETRRTGGASGASSGENEASGGLGLTGTVLAGRYRVESRLGAGGMASVYEATDERLGRAVVVKVPHAALLVDPGFRKRFASEVNSLAKLEHPNIIPIHDVGEHDGVPFAVVQFLRGGDLGDRIKAQIAKSGTALSPQQCLEWLPRIAETLDFVHSRGFLHRDVSPGNIIFDEHGHAHLSDFGIATAVTNDADEGQLTRPGGFVGAATYAPPESIERGLNPTYDQYSLGVVVYEALSGQLPFERGSAEATLVAKNTRPPTPLSEKVAGLPPGVVAAVMQAISKDPSQRFESSSAFVDALRAAVATQRPAADTPKTQVVSASQLSEAARRPDRGVPWTKLAGGFVLLALVGAVVYFTKPWLQVSPPTREGGETAVATTTAGVSFSAGSTPAEVDAAVAICQQTQGRDCARSDYEDETPRTVAIAPMAFDPHEVTNRDFAAWVSETGYQTTAEKLGYSWDPFAKGTNLSWKAPTRDGSYQDRLDHPVVHVSPVDAEAYCEAQGRRLPTAEEWEYAARGLERRAFPWGDTWSSDRAVWKTEDSRAVGSLPAGKSWSGLDDMAGNVWEWTSTVTGSGTPIAKGGSWFEHNGAFLRGATQMELESRTWTSADIGFRCTRDL